MLSKMANTLNFYLRLLTAAAFSICYSLTFSQRMFQSPSDLYTECMQIAILQDELESERRAELNFHSNAGISSVKLHEADSMKRYCRVCAANGFDAYNCDLTKCAVEHGMFHHRFRYCICQSGWHGDHCEQLMCSGHGRIVEPIHRYCLCDQYWEGSNCSEIACVNGGQPNPGQSACVGCDFPYSGRFCHQFVWQTHISNAEFMIITVTIPSLVCLLVVCCRLAVSSKSLCSSHKPQRSDRFMGANGATDIRLDVAIGPDTTLERKRLVARTKRQHMIEV